MVSAILYSRRRRSKYSSSNDRSVETAGINLCMILNAVQGTLKGYDQLVNIVLDEAEEYERGESSLLLSYSASGAGPSLLTHDSISNIRNFRFLQILPTL